MWFISKQEDSILNIYLLLQLTLVISTAYLEVKIWSLHKMFNNK